MAKFEEIWRQVIASRDGKPGHEKDQITFAILQIDEVSKLLDVALEHDPSMTSAIRNWQQDLQAIRHRIINNESGELPVYGGYRLIDIDKDGEPIYEKA